MSDDPNSCPNCGSEQLICRELYANGRQWECRECGHEFMRDEPPPNGGEPS